MSQRVTRSRGVKLTLPEEQPKIRDLFSVSRTRRTAKKVLDVPVPVHEEKAAPVVQAAPETKKRIKREAPQKTVSEETVSIKPEPSKSVSEPIIERAEVIAPLSPPRRARKTPTPNNSPVSKPTTARKALFSAEVAPESVSVECPVLTTTKKASTKIRTVAQLQAALAQKGAVRKIHEQNTVNKSRQVEEHVSNLKSPVKAVPRGKVLETFQAPKHASPLKKATYVKQIERPIIERPSTPEERLPAPDYVLPSYTTPAKEVNSDEERELEEKKRVFEYGKAARLIAPVKENASVPLPSKYQTLLESFQSCDRILSIYMNQGRRCVLNEIQKNVQKNTKRDFNLKNMAQVMQLYPTSYHLKLEEQWHAFGGTTSGKYEHVISANITDDLKDFMLPESPRKVVQDELPLVTPGKCLSPMKSPRKKCVAPVARAPELDCKPKLEGWRMTCRSHIMRYLLAEKVKKCYRSFMEKIGAPEPQSPIRRFHPKFVVKMENECEDLEQAPLPEPPRRDENLKHMRDFMNSVDIEAKLPNAVDIALKELKSPVKSLVSASTSVPLSPKKFAQLQASKPKGTMTLLERIRAKEAAKKLADSMKDPIVEKKKALLQRLEQSMLRSIICLFTQKQCRSLELNTVIEKLVYNGGRTLSNADVKSHIEMLCEVAPSLCCIKEVVARKYLQISEPDFRKLGDIVKNELQRIAE